MQCSPPANVNVFLCFYLSWKKIHVDISSLEASENGKMLMYHFAASGWDECWALPEHRWTCAALCGATSQPSWVQPQTHLWTAGRKRGKDVIKMINSEVTGSSQKELAFTDLKRSVYLWDSKCKSFSMWFQSFKTEWMTGLFFIHWPWVFDIFHPRVLSRLQTNDHVEGFPAKHKSREY